MTTITPRPRRPRIPSALLHAAACAALGVGAMGAVCNTKPIDDDDDLVTTASTGTGSTGPTSGDPGTVDGTTDTPPETTNTPPTTTVDPDTTTADPTTGDPTGAAGCIAPGIYGAQLGALTDPHGHFPYLKLFYDPEAPEQTTDEQLEVTVAADGVITVSVLPRSTTEFEGHDGLIDLSGSLAGGGQGCTMAIATSAPFVAGGSPFGTVDVALGGDVPELTVGSSAVVSLTLEGGDIPNGPIEYTVTLVPQ